MTEQSPVPKRPMLTQPRVMVTIALAALLCVLGALAAISRRPSRAPEAVNSGPEDRPSPVADSLDPPRPKRIEPAAPLQSAAVSGEAQRARASGEYTSTDKSTDWSVIAATLNDWDAAQRRAQSLRSQWRQCDCKVYPPPGQGGKYFVVLGSGLGRNDADRLRDTATAAGMPPDTYVTKLVRASSSAE